MQRILWRFTGHIVRLSAGFVLVTVGIFRIFFPSLQPKSRLLAIIGQTATPNQMAILHRQIDPGPHAFFPRYLHWVSGLYLPYVIPAIIVIAAVAVVSRGYRRTPHDTVPKASAAILIGGLMV